jgi:hypothetical protein
MVLAPFFGPNTVGLLPEVFAVAVVSFLDLIVPCAIFVSLLVSESCGSCSFWVILKCDVGKFWGAAASGEAYLPHLQTNIKSSSLTTKRSEIKVQIGFIIIVIVIAIILKVILSWKSQ